MQIKCLAIFLNNALLNISLHVCLAFVLLREMADDFICRGKIFIAEWVKFLQTIIMKQQFEIEVNRSSSCFPSFMTIQAKGEKGQLSGQNLTPFVFQRQVSGL